MRRSRRQQGRSERRELVCRGIEHLNRAARGPGRHATGDHDKPALAGARGCVRLARLCHRHERPRVGSWREDFRARKRCRDAADAARHQHAAVVQLRRGVAAPSHVQWRRRYGRIARQQHFRTAQHAIGIFATNDQHAAIVEQCRRRTISRRQQRAKRLPCASRSRRRSGVREKTECECGSGRENDRRETTRTVHMRLQRHPESPYVPDRARTSPRVAKAPSGQERDHPRVRRRHAEIGPISRRFRLCQRR